MSNQGNTSRSGKNKNLLSFFSRKPASTSEDIPPRPYLDVVELPINKFQKIDTREADERGFLRDLGLREPLWTFDVNIQDELRRKYVSLGPYQPPPPPRENYPLSNFGTQKRRFVYNWFSKHHWLEYSEEKDKVYCFPCYLFDTNPPKFHVFTVDGFSNWKRVNDPKHDPFITHEGAPDSAHHANVQKLESLKMPSQHINKVVLRQTSKQRVDNRLRVKVSMLAVKWLAKQGCAFRDHDESSSSSNQGNFVELIKYLASWNEDVNNVVLDNAPGNARYLSPGIQKEMLSIVANNVRRKIRAEIGDAKFCILVDEALDASNKEKMAIILRFVNRERLIQERFFDIVGVDDTTSVTLQQKIYAVLRNYDLPIRDLRGQGYDGASNMRGQWNGLQALVTRDCPYAYYVHFFAHRLQLALVASTKDVDFVWVFFSLLNSIVNLISASPQRLMELHHTRENDLAKKLALGELNTGKGVNQSRSLQRLGATRWSSHFGTVTSLLELFPAVQQTLKNLNTKGKAQEVKGQARGCLSTLTSFEFIFILHLMNEVLGVTDVFCRSLQLQNQDIVNALENITVTKMLLQKLRDDGWDSFFDSVISFCKEYDIVVPDMHDVFAEGNGRSCRQNGITYDHHYRVDIFTDVLDFQLKELDDRFSTTSMELLKLSSSLSPIFCFRYFDIDNICKLARDFYPQDFPDLDLHKLKRQLQFYEVSVCTNPEYQQIETMSELCRRLIEDGKSQTYYLIDRLIRLVLTLPVSTATTERAFSAMKHIKTTIRNKMSDEFLADSMIVYIEKDIADNIDIEKMIDEFDMLKDRRVPLK